MNNDVEDLLRQGMLRYTADLHAPAAAGWSARPSAVAGGDWRSAR